uniref:DOT1 domain-containing protein n=1 Tax=Spongospora subterranea TaxID=70186 RepID=A0A0H5RBT7_9EUKA|eukprot:CRZ11493.1 hypothetical protein [Spongospora subterranea]
MEGPATISDQQSVIRLQALTRGFISRRRNKAVFDTTTDRLCPYVPTPEPIVKGALFHLGIKECDVFVDLGCGDGRVIIAAVEQFGCKAIGVELDSALADQAERSASMLRQRNHEVSSRISIVHGSYLHESVHSIVHDASIIWMFLTPRAQTDVIEQVLRKCTDGTRIASFVFPLPSLFIPDSVIDLSQYMTGQMNKLYIYTIINPDNL